MFLLHNQVLLLSKGWTSKPSITGTGQHTGQWRPAKKEQRLWTCVPSNSFVKFLKVWVENKLPVVGWNYLSGKYTHWKVFFPVSQRFKVQSSKFVQLSCDVAWSSRFMFLQTKSKSYFAIPIWSLLCQRCQLASGCELFTPPFFFNNSFILVWVVVDPELIPGFLRNTSWMGYQAIAGPHACTYSFILIIT